MGTDDNAETVKRFLEKPKDRKCLDAFFKLCYRQVIGCLDYLKALGYQLPVEPISERNPLSDLTIDILGSYLRSRHRQPYYLIFEFFSKQGITDFKTADADILFSLYRVQLYRIVRQEIIKIGGGADPPTHNLKRRFKEILKGPDYVSFRSGNAPAEYVCSVGNAENQDKQKPVISYESLLSFVEAAFHEDSSKNRSEWCRNIFSLLDSASEYRKCIKKSDLLRAVISVNAKYVEPYAPRPAPLPGPEYKLYLAVVEAARKETLDWLDSEVLQRFIRKGRIPADVAQLFLQAAEMYLLDLVYSPDVDLLPVYFREVMPEREHDLYLNQYKYVFETTIQKAEADFQARFGKKL